ncbi:PREDICTED: poliovirus receptor homolog [Colobus angolensis palliatus]|uniref:poliovirus receptor homolog n=1 Tax=Colobus angolensis palliatus TaxID=336983 RepID=UPI0005F3A437|nr:PREDICTED: poliovirus receptor homolog [Colobus angolensis palliatus]
MAAAWPLLLLLALMALSWPPPGTGDVVVQAPTQVPGFLGDSVTLPCYLQVPGMEETHVSQLTWSRHGESGSMAVFHPTQGSHYSEPKRLEFVAARLGTELRDASLRMFRLRVEDEGNYTCVFFIFPQGSRSVDIWLRVLAKPQNTAEVQKVQLTGKPVPVARWLPVSEPLCSFPADPPEVSISGYDNNWYLSQNEATLTCDARSNPEPTGYNWSTTMGPLPPFAVAQGAQLLIRPVDKPINTTFICNVTNALGARQAELTVQVKEGPPSEHSGMSSNVIIFLILGIVILLTLLGIGLYFYRSRYSCEFLWHHHLSPSSKEYASASANGYISYSDVSREASFCQDPQTEGTR